MYFLAYQLISTFSTPMSSHSLLDQIALPLSMHEKGIIVEIGSAREKEIEKSSTFYFRELAEKINMTFYSVDLSVESYKLAFKILNSFAIHQDGESFLNDFCQHTSQKIVILYLDNYDVIYNDKHRQSLMRRVGTLYTDYYDSFSNEKSAQVHLSQLIAAVPHLADKCIIIIDDTKLLDDLTWWGKGALAVPFLLDINYTIIASSDDGVALCSPSFLQP